MEMNHLLNVFSLISRNLISKPEFQCLSAESHEWLFIYKSALSLLFTPCSICLCGRRRRRTRVLLPDKIMPKLAEFRGSCSQRSPLHRCVCIEDFQLTASLFLYLVSHHAALGLPTVKTWKSLIWGQISNTFAFCHWPGVRPDCKAVRENQRTKNLKSLFPFLSPSTPWLLARPLWHFLWAHLKVSNKASALCSLA